MEFLYKYFNDFGTRVTRHIMDNCLIFFLVYKKDVSDVFDTYAWNNATLKLAVTQEISCHFPDKSSNMKEWYLVDVKGLDKYLSSSDKNWQLFEQYVIEDAGYYGKDWLEKKEFDKFLERISDRLEGFKKLFNTDHQYNNFVNKIKTNFKII